MVRAATVKKRVPYENGAATCAKLFLEYMNAVCVKEDDRGNDVASVLKDADFLGRGEGNDHKGSVQGCGEFNPVLILSNDKIRAFERTDDKEGRNAANQPNRRVLAFLFKPGTRIVPGKWPCRSPKGKNPGEILPCSAVEGSSGAACA